MASRRPWDDMGVAGTKAPVPALQERVSPEKPKERTLEDQAKLLGKHCIFGGLIGSISGMSLAAVEIVRDPKAITTGSGAGARAKTLRYSGIMGGFFAAFHGVRQGLSMALPTSGDRMNDFIQNTAISSGICITPLLMHSRLRSVIPYGIALIGLDAINAYTEGIDQY